MPPLLFVLGHVPTWRNHPRISSTRYRPLAKWITKQRGDLKNDNDNDNEDDGNNSRGLKMTPEQRQRLLDLGFVAGFNKNSKGVPTKGRQEQFDVAFERRITELTAFRKEHGEYFLLLLLSLTIIFRIIVLIPETLLLIESACYSLDHSSCLSFLPSFLPVAELFASSSAFLWSLPFIIAHKTKQRPLEYPLHDATC
jgi:hypothetical protein